MSTIIQTKLASSTEVDVYVYSDHIAGKLYRVTKTDEGVWGCTCPDHIFRHRDCKHIKRIQREIEEQLVGRML